jgi:hypothetical protein
MTVGDHNILIAGSVKVFASGSPRLGANLEQSSCFTGGMLVRARAFAAQQILKTGDAWQMVSRGPTATRSLA